MKRTTATLALLALVALVLAACGGDDSAGPTPAATEPAASEPEAEPGGGSTGDSEQADGPASPAEPEPAAKEPAPSEGSADGSGGPTSAGTTPSGKELLISPDGADQLRVNTSGWETDFTRHTVPLDEFMGGGPPRDGIPPIDEPTFDTVAQAGEYLAPSEPVVEVVAGGEVRGYPLRVLIWHEIVNDTIGEVPVSVTFCPLCYTAIAFDRRFGDQVLDFGTTGNLRNSDLVMWDRQTETWWQQFSGEGVIGQHAGELLTHVPAAIAAFEDFAARNPDAMVLSQDTGVNRPYGENPYVGYDTIDQRPFFPVENLDDDRLPPKQRVVLIDRAGDTVAVPFDALESAGTIAVDVAGEALTVEFVAGVRSALNYPNIKDSEKRGAARVTDVTGELVPFDTPFWFAVAAFRPDARIVTS